MTIDRPTPSVEPQLKQLWQEAFGDDAEFVELFFRTGYAPHRCRVLCEGDRLLAALYWFDCSFNGRPVAYLYAVAATKQVRGQGYGKLLLEDTHAHLAALGYAGCALSPAAPRLAEYYATLGYQTFQTRQYHTCSAAEAIALQPVTKDTYAALRKTLLPHGALHQEGALLDFLAAFMELYAGDGFLLAAHKEGEKLYVAELLGTQDCAPGIVAALGCREGRFPIPGGDPFAMYRPLCPEGSLTPTYLGLDLG